MEYEITGVEQDYSDQNISCYFVIFFNLQRIDLLTHLAAPVAQVAARGPSGGVHSGAARAGSGSGCEEEQGTVGYGRPSDEG